MVFKSARQRMAVMAKFRAGERAFNIKGSPSQREVIIDGTFTSGGNKFVNARIVPIRGKTFIPTVINQKNLRKIKVR